MNQLNFSKNKAIYGNRWWEFRKLIHRLKLKSAIERHRLTDCLEILEEQGIESETALELLPMVGGIQ